MNIDMEIMGARSFAEFRINFPIKNGIFAMRKLIIIEMKVGNG